MSREGVLYWITGLSGAGKTTIGSRLYYEIKKTRDNVVFLDGDILKDLVSDDVDYSEDGRRKRAMKYARLCSFLTGQGITVICCTIAMFDSVREWNRLNNKAYCEVFLDVSVDKLIERDQKGLYSGALNNGVENVYGINIYAELPKNPDIVLKNDGDISIKECVDSILAFEVIQSSDFDRDSQYWNKFYNSISDSEMSKPSSFAQWIAQDIKSGKSLLELGCGNGRDSVYFAREMNMIVTAIDASEDAIKSLQEKYSDDNIYFICDDFVCSSMIFAREYDYCYSRFTLHAINEKQEDEVIRNVYKALKSGGNFYIESRSINDELYGKGDKVGRNAYKYDGHYRRFIVRSELEDKLTDAGFMVLYSEEKTGFAKWNNDDPMIIRIIAKKE